MKSVLTDVDDDKREEHVEEMDEEDDRRSTSASVRGVARHAPRSSEQPEMGKGSREAAPSQMIAFRKTCSTIDGPKAIGIAASIKVHRHEGYQSCRYPTSIPDLRNITVSAALPPSTVAIRLIHFRFNIPRC